MISHVPRPVHDLGFGSMLYVAMEVPSELVIFIHGFNGASEETWEGFQEQFHQSPWNTFDVLFVGYDSTKENILSVVGRLRDKLPAFYPTIPQEYLTAGYYARAQAQYGGLRVIGHSLGGLIARRLMVELVRTWLHAADPNNAECEVADLDAITAARPALLDAQLRLFSPASEGFYPKGWLGTIDASVFGRLSNLFLWRSPAFRDLQVGSEFLKNTKEQTVFRIRQLGAAASALRPHTLWANPDHVVQVEDYPTDHPSKSADKRTHVSVCKPTSTYHDPFLLVEK